MVHFEKQEYILRFYCNKMQYVSNKVKVKGHLQCLHSFLAGPAHQEDL